MYKFNSQFSVLDAIHHPFGTKDIQQEEMLYKCSREAVREKGGLIANTLLDWLPLDWYKHEIVVDTRSHMLMKDMYPCIPGWHHDYVERDRNTGQPDYNSMDYHSEHLLFLIGDVAPTQFAVGEASYNPVAEGTNVYSQWHKETEEHIRQGNLVVHSAPTNTWVLFDDFSMHQGVAAETNAWRFFIRVSRFFKIVDGNRVYLKPPKYANEIRKQVQVYMKDPYAGW